MRAARALAERLRGHPEVAWVRSGLDEDQLADLYDLYFPLRHAFLHDVKNDRRPRQQSAQPTADMMLVSLAVAIELDEFLAVCLTIGSRERS